MAITVEMGRRAGDSVTPARRIDAVKDDHLTLRGLFNQLAKRHPELAPILEDATEADDLEIRLNDHPLSRARPEQPLHDGDTLRLIVKQP